MSSGETELAYAWLIIKLHWPFPHRMLSKTSSPNDIAKYHWINVIELDNTITVLALPQIVLCTLETIITLQISNP